MKNPIYSPREDTLLLAKAVEKFAKGNVLDMCTGTGYLANKAIETGNVDSVLAVDVNTEALVHGKKTYKDPRITFLQSHLFENVKGVFDTIICNPPYLPEDRNIQDVALDGGKHGYEFSVMFLKKARFFLKDDGVILFLFSSLTHKDVIEKTLLENAYLFEEEQRQKLDFETLYTYKIKKLESLVKDAKRLAFFSKGKRGVIYTGVFKGKKVGIKIKNPDSEAPARIFIEGNNLKEANKLGIGPKIVQAKEQYLIYEFVEGTQFPKFLEKSGRKDTIKVISQLFSQMRTLDLNKMSKEEMTNPYKHIIITENNEAVLLDFERTHKDLKPKNVTQLVQYLVSKSMEKALKSKGIIIDRQRILSLAKIYKSNYEEKIFDEIARTVK